MESFIRLTNDTSFAMTIAHQASSRTEAISSKRNLAG
jgi:hypothetical protein